MTNPVHIAETAILLAIAYQAGWFVAFFARRLFAGGSKPAAISAERLAVARGETGEPLVKAPQIDPVAAMPVPAVAKIAPALSEPMAPPPLPAAPPLPPIVMPPAPVIPPVDLGAMPPVTESAALSSFLEVLEATPSPEDLEPPAPNPKSIPAVERMLAEILGLDAEPEATPVPVEIAREEETFSPAGAAEVAADSPTLEPAEPAPPLAPPAEEVAAAFGEDAFAPQPTPLFVAEIEPAGEDPVAAADRVPALPPEPTFDHADPVAPEWAREASAETEQSPLAATASEDVPDRFELEPAPFELAVATAVEAAAAAVQSLLPSAVEPDAAADAAPEPVAEPAAQDITAAEPEPEFVFDLPPASSLPPPRAEPEPEPPPPALKPASRPGEAWSGRPVPPSPSVLAAVVGAALDIDAEAEAMRAVEGGWTRRSATPPPAPVALEEPEPEPAAEFGPQTHVEGGFGRPPALVEPRSGGKDDLRQIKGIAAADEAALNVVGIFHFDQIAAWDQKAVVWMENREFGRGRIAREKWLEQARELTRGRAPGRVVRR